VFQRANGVWLYDLVDWLVLESHTARAPARAALSAMKWLPPLRVHAARYCMHRRSGLLRPAGRQGRSNPPGPARSLAEDARDVEPALGLAGPARKHPRRVGVLLDLRAEDLLRLGIELSVVQVSPDRHTPMGTLIATVVVDTVRSPHI